MGFTERFSRILYPPGVTHLDTKVASALFLILFSTQLTLTTPFSYLPAMVSSFGYKDKERGIYAGMIASSLFLGRFISGYFWGWLTDKLGRRPVLLISALLTYIATVAFGFTTNLYWALTTRFLQGLFNGVIVVGRAAFSEICDDTNQAIGVSLIFAAWNSAIVLGPAVGGFLATPVKKYPSVFQGVSKTFFAKFAFLLPSTLISLILFVSIVMVYLFFEETMPKMRMPTPEDPQSSETKRLLVEEAQEIDEIISEQGVQLMKVVEDNREPRPTIEPCCTSVRRWSIFQLCSDKYVVLVVIMFGFSGFCIIGFSELRSLWMATNTKYGGLSFSTDQIGVALLVPALVAVVLQPIIFSRLERRFGGIMTLQATLVVLAVCTGCFPLLHITYENKYILWSLMITMGIFRMVSDISSRSCIALFINNSVYSDQVGRANGLAFSVQEVMRVASPTMFGGLFAWSISNKYHAIRFPFDYRFSFLVITFFILIILTLTFVLPISINAPKRNCEPLHRKK